MDADFELNEFGLDNRYTYQEFNYTSAQNQFLDDLLKTLTVETRVLIKAILEVERQEEIKGFCMLTVIRHMALQVETPSMGLYLDDLKNLFYLPDLLCAK